MRTMARVHYEIEDDLHRRAKAAAAMEGITLKALIEQGMEMRIAAAGLASTDIRPSLAERLRGQADWRRHIADEWPEDTRNARAQSVLEDAAAQAMRLDVDDPVLRRIAAAYAPSGEVWFGQEADSVLKAAGFGGAGSAGELLEQLADAADHDLDIAAGDDNDGPERSGA